MLCTIYSVSPTDYPYKAYISNCLTYNTLVKACQLTQEGWYNDLSSHMDSSSANTGFTERMNLFRKDGDENGAYKSEGTTFIGNRIRCTIFLTVLSNPYYYSFPLLL